MNEILWLLVPLHGQTKLEQPLSLEFIMFIHTKFEEITLKYFEPDESLYNNIIELL